MPKKLKKIQNLIRDLVFNTLGFGIYIATQQILLMPIMARILPEEDFAKVVLYISVFAIITNVLGSELGIVKQVKKEKISEESDYNRILLQLFPTIILIAIMILAILRFNILEIIMLTITIILGNTRLYSAAHFRANKDFKKIVMQNILYLVGTAIGLFITYKLKLIAIPMLLAEIMCLIFDITKTDIIKTGISKTKHNKEIWNTFAGFGFISFLINMTTYFDKIIIYPILGENAVNVYYATSSMSKILSLITNPLHGVILSWLKGNDEEFKKKATTVTLKANMPILIITFVLSLPLTYIAVIILYPQYLEDSKKLIIPICVGVAFSTAASIIKAILMKYIESKKLVKMYVIYNVILLVGATIASYYFGITGFAYATAIASTSLWIMFILLLNRTNTLQERKIDETK
jgi:O-antigen/teichoic acid export membrane protein